MTNEELTELLDKVLDQLGEHFSSVQIVATIHESTATGTSHYSRGLGDFYARRGAVDKWLRDDAADDYVFRKLKMEREDDEE